jgi:2,4-dienoyl-CoA reductase-like NADH-dependent reductase (Old Yellow Enzyme family)
VGLDTDTFSDLHENHDPKLRIQQDLALVLKRFERGEFDLVGVGRNHIANPDFVTMVRAGRFEELECFNKAIHLKAFLDDFDLDATIRGGVR